MKSSKLSLFLFLHFTVATLHAQSMFQEFGAFVAACYNKPYEMGTIVPCSDSVGKAIVQYVKPGMRCLEIGAGTGNLTPHIVQALQGQGFVDAVEINQELCEVATKNLKDCKNAYVRCCSILDWNPAYKYDVVICTLPFNLFSKEFTEHVLLHVKSLLTPEATFSYVEYLLLGKIKSIFLAGQASKDFQELREYLAHVQNIYLLKTSDVYLNIPPLRIYHLALGHE